MCGSKVIGPVVGGVTERVFSMVGDCWYESFLLPSVFFKNCRRFPILSKKVG